MTTHKIRFLPYDMEIEVEDGETLIRAALEAGVHVNASCGGEGVCGKCRVIIEEGTVEIDGNEQAVSGEAKHRGVQFKAGVTIPFGSSS